MKGGFTIIAERANNPSLHELHIDPERTQFLTPRENPRGTPSLSFSDAAITPKKPRREGSVRQRRLSAARRRRSSTNVAPSNKVPSIQSQTLHVCHMYDFEGSMYAYIPVPLGVSGNGYVDGAPSWDEH